MQMSTTLRLDFEVLKMGQNFHVNQTWRGTVAQSQSNMEGYGCTEPIKHGGVRLHRANQTWRGTVAHSQSNMEGYGCT